MSGFKSPALKGAAIRPAAARRVQPTGILHFTIGVSDLERSRRFYEDVVGCTYWRQNDSAVFMRCGEDYFVLSRSGYHAAPNRDKDTLIHHAFVVAAEDFDAAVAHLEASGVEVLLYEDKGHRSFTGRHLYFHDPDGNAIEFIDFQGIGDVAASAYEDRERRRAKTHLQGSVSEK
ncbi:MAG: glyoxylase family protein [Alphaproteobacteria bacterium]|jgi:catechol 2,3-dioxygenase-like lactoylglutathione lyase family enzyme|nr:glyoxylase family protein [Alphaproteobacteria bacterium]